MQRRAGSLRPARQCWVVPVRHLLNSYIIILILRKTVFENSPICLLFICFFQATLSKGQQRFAPYWRRAKVALQHSKNGAFSRSELFMETQHNTTRFFAEARIYESARIVSWFFAQIIQSDIKTTTQPKLLWIIHYVCIFFFICDLFKILLWSSKNIA